jgi:hypothetical protein
MTRILLAQGAGVRDVGRFPEFATLNMILEQTSSDQETGVALIGRPGQDEFADTGGGPSRAVFKKAGLFGGDWLVVHGQTLFRISTSATVVAAVGTIPGTGRVRIAAGPNADGDSEARIVNGDAIYLFDGTTVTQEAFPDDAGVTDILYIRGFWIAIRTGTQQLYSRVPGDTVWDPITFTSAEYQPDLAVALAALGDTVIVLGETSTEPFALTGTAANPIEPYGGSAQDVGVRNRDTVISFAGAVWAVGNDCSVYKFTPQGRKVSNPGIAERIRKTSAADLRMWGFTQDEHAYVVVTLSDETHVYDDTNDRWQRWRSNGYNFFRGHLGVEVSGKVLCADALPSSGLLWLLNPEKLTDAGDEIERMVSGYVEVKGGSVSCNNVTLRCAVGVGTATGQGVNPRVGMSYSDDDGRTWDEWMWRDLGKVGKYETEVRWNSLGTIKAPGRHFRWRITDPVQVRITDARMNEA